jgi:hypothetical protein
MDTFSSNEGMAPLATWFRSIRVRNVDLVGDFAGKELFVVHGEGLLLHCLAEYKVDLHGTFRSSDSSCHPDAQSAHRPAPAGPPAELVKLGSF